MISARIFILVAMIIKQVYHMILQRVADIQRKKPLPEEVADVFDAERYQTYLDYTADIKKVLLTVGFVRNQSEIFVR